MCDYDYNLTFSILLLILTALITTKHSPVNSYSPGLILSVRLSDLFGGPCELVAFDGAAVGDVARHGAPSPAVSRLPSPAVSRLRQSEQRLGGRSLAGVGAVPREWSEHGRLLQPRGTLTAQR